LSLSELKRDLQNKLGITRQGVESRANTIKRKYPPLSTDDAICWIAIDEGMDLTKYFDARVLVDQQAVDRIWHRRQSALPTAQTQPSPRRPRAAPKTVRVTVGRGLTITNPLLTPRVMKDATTMAEHVYPIMYVFENSVREFITRVLRNVHGDGWWSAAAPSEVKNLVQGRMAQEKKHAWHGRRGAHEIFYTDIEDLRRLVTSNRNWPHFEPLLHDQNWFATRVSEIKLSRNIVAHNNPLLPNDVKRLEVYFQEWQDLITAVRHLIP